MKSILKWILIILTSVTSAHLSAQQLKVIAYNVEFGKNTSPEEMSTLLKSEKADIICFNEVPAQGWTKDVGKLLGLSYVYEGKIASANHTEGFDDKTKKYYGKYKSILSKYPLEDTQEISLNGIGWSPATAVVATVIVNKKNAIKVFSLHIPSGKKEAGNSKAYHLAQILAKDYSEVDKMIIAGDLNDLSESQPLKYLYDQGLNNPWKVLDMDVSGSTTLSRSETNGYVIDHILYKGFNLKSTGIIEEKIQSDHKPVWSLFKL